MSPTPGAIAEASRTHAKRARDRDQAAGFNADERASKREATPVVIAGVTFNRRRKDWHVSRVMRQTMRAQEKAIALSTRLKARVAELEVQQAEAAADGQTDREDELEGKIDELVRRADDALEDAELVTYRLLALLLVPPAEGYGEDNTPLNGFGPDPATEDEAAVMDAVGFLQPALDVEDAAALARELTGSDDEPDPQRTPSNGSGST